MDPRTIENGIDLGIHKARIACLNRIDIEIFRNAEEFEYTPSAVWTDKKCELGAWRVAKDFCEREPDNAFMEFKRYMGTDTDCTSPAAAGI